MSVTIELTPEQESRLRAKAKQAGLTPETLSPELIEEIASSSLAGAFFAVLIIALLMKQSPVSPEQQELLQMLTQPLIDQVLRDGTDEEIAALLPRLPEESATAEPHPAGEWPGLEMRGGTVYIGGTGIKVRLLAEATRQGYTVADLQEAHPQLTLAQIHAALAYYYAHQQEMDADLAQRALQVEEWRSKSGQPTRQELEERLRQQGYQMTPDGLKKSA
jgi:uncharacterized protein (DUF433 family)